MKFLIRLFRRETSSKEFIPEIDGLRFLAIVMVVLFHTNAFISEKSNSLSFAENSIQTNRAWSIFGFGNQGVQLFFVISGFILAIPLMRFYFGISEKKPSLKNYFLRRLTRLEPPYILSLTLLFLLTVLIVGSKHSISILTASLFASLFYLHNFIFPGEFPYLNGVTWSLEVEVQYYILAPLIVWGLCGLKNKIFRRLFILILITLFSFLGWLLEVYWAVQTVTLGGYLQYFLSGILLCDFYLLEHKTHSRLNNIIVFGLGVILLGLIIGVEHAKSANLGMRIMSPLLILAFYAIVFWHDWWKRIFSLNVLTLIGGMCYSIYLLHYSVISAVGRLTINRFYLNNYNWYFTVQSLILITAVLIVSAMYFLLIEKPCMKRDWYLKFYQNSKLFRPTDKTYKLTTDK